MKRRLRTYREVNESKVAEPSVQDFFSENNITLFTKDAATEFETVMNSLKIYIERVEKPNNFRNLDEPLEAKRRILVERQNQIAEEKQRLYVLGEEGVEKELKKQKEKNVK